MAENNQTATASCQRCVGYAYVPVQTLNNTYNSEDGLMQGTIFPELNLTIDEYGSVCKGCGGVCNE